MNEKSDCRTCGTCGHYQPVLDRCGRHRNPCETVKDCPDWTPDTRKTDEL